MESNTDRIESLLVTAKKYVQESVKLIKLKAIDKVSDVVSSFASSIIAIALIGSTFLFANLGLAFWLGEILGRVYYGFIAVAGFYGFLAIIFYIFFYKCVKKRVRNNIIKKMLK